MRKLLFISTLALAAFSSAHDLFADYDRSVSTRFTVSSYGTSVASGFRPGFVENPLQVLLGHDQYAYIKPDESEYVNAFGARNPGFNSSIWWNFGGSPMTANGRTIVPGRVSMHNVDRIPAVDVVFQGSPSQPITVTLTTEANPIGAATTPGNVVLATQVNGAWTNLYNLALNQNRSDTRTVTFNAHTRVRLMITRSGVSAASASVVFRYQLG